MNKIIDKLKEVKEKSPLFVRRFFVATTGALALTGVGVAVSQEAPSMSPASAIDCDPQVGNGCVTVPGESTLPQETKPSVPETTVPKPKPTVPETTVPEATTTTIVSTPPNRPPMTIVVPPTPGEQPQTPVEAVPHTS